MNRRSFLSKIIGAAAFGALAKAVPRKPAAAPAELVPNPAWVEAPHEVHFEMSPETFQRWYGGKLHENRIQGMAHDLVQADFADIERRILAYHPSGSMGRPAGWIGRYYEQPPSQEFDLNILP